MEGSLSAAIRGMKRRLPGLEMYQRIFPDPDMGTMIVDAYKSVIELAIEGTKYYKKGGRRE
jgi:hypothetical protein